MTALPNHRPRSPPTVDPAHVNRTLTPDDEADVRSFLRAHLASLDGSLRACRICLYTVTPDHHFVIDRHPEFPQVAIAAGFSGHGFKFASVVGEILADLADAGRTDLPISMFRADRFGAGKA